MCQSKMGANSKCEPKQGEQGLLIPTKVYGKMPSLEQRLRTVAFLGAFYNGFSMTVMRPLLTKLLSLHPNWKALGKRAGLFNKSAQVEVLYALMQGLHHSLGGYLFSVSRRLREEQECKGEDEAEPTFGPFNWRGLALYAGMWEYQYEWGDWAMMIAAQWPYADRNPKFMFLLTAHHLFGMLTFFLGGTQKGLNKSGTYLAERVLGCAGIGLILYPIQQLADLQTKAGLRTARNVSIVGILLTLYSRFYIFPKCGYELLKQEGFLQKVKDEKTNEMKYSTKSKLMIAGGSALSIFNLLVIHGTVKKLVSYHQQLSKYK